MKKIIISLLIISIGISVSGQQLTKQDYLQKSKSQNTTAWLLLGGGTAMSVGAIFWSLDNLFSADQGQGALFIAGVCAMGGSIPLFIASGRNKRIANGMTFNFKAEKSYAFQSKRNGSGYYPAVSITIPLK